jgi:septal ring factor EnvC (AmiA/AmiB activator)
MPEPTLEFIGRHLQDIQAEQRLQRMRFDILEQRFSSLDLRLGGIEERLAAIDDKLDRSVSATIAAEIQEIVATETRRALRAHEEELTAMVRSVVGAAIAEMLNGKGV